MDSFMEAMKPRSIEDAKILRLELIEEADAIASRLEAGGEVTATERARFEEITKEGGLGEQAAAVVDEKLNIKAKRDRLVAERAGLNFEDNFVGGLSEALVGPTARRDDGLKLRDSSGRWHATQASNQASCPRAGHQEPSFGELAAFAITGDQSHLEGKQLMAATSHGSDSTGGIFVPTTTFGGVIDQARAAMVTGRAGTRTVVLDSAEMTVVKVTGDPSGSYVRELGSIPGTDASFGSIVLRPKKFAFLIPISNEAIEDAVGLSQQLQSLSASVMAQAMDLAVLSGSGAEGQPRGILNTDDVNSMASVGTPTSYGDLTSAVRQIYDANYQGDVNGLAWIKSPREWQTYADLADTTGQPLSQPPAIDGLQTYNTTGVDDGTMIVGDFSQSLIALRSSMGARIEILREGVANTADGDSLNAIQNDMTWIRVTSRFDVATLRPNWFTTLTGVTAA